MPEEDKFSRGIPRDQLSLKPLRVESWAGAIWVCMGPGAPTLSEYLGPVMEMIEPFRPQDMTLVEDQSCRLECNWKAVASRGMLATPTAGDTFLKIEKGCLFLLTADTFKAVLNNRGGDIRYGGEFNPINHSSLGEVPCDWSG